MNTIKQNTEWARQAAKFAEQHCQEAIDASTQMREAARAGEPQWRLLQLNHKTAIAATSAAGSALSAATYAMNEQRANLSGIAKHAAWKAQVASEMVRSSAALLQWGLDGQGTDFPEMRAELGLVV